MAAHIHTPGAYHPNPKMVRGRPVHRMKAATGKAQKRTRKEMAMMRMIMGHLDRSEYEEAEKMMARMKKIAKQQHIIEK